MLSFVVTSCFAFVIYLLLTVGSGAVLIYWSSQELLVAAGVAMAVGLLSRKYFASIPARSRVALNPLRWLLAVVYVVGPLFLEMAKANFDVALRVLTGRIRPGIVRIKTGMHTDLGTLMLANSITLTPGTLTVDIQEDTNDLFVHMINIPEGMETREFLEAREVFSIFDCPGWLRRIAE